MKELLKLPGLFSAICLIIVSCHDGKKDVDAKTIFANSINDSATKVVMKTFGLPYPEKFKFDSNALLFYCARSYDTSSLIYLQKDNENIRGVFYVILPTYHRFLADYADQKSNLLFFEGYSFIIDSKAWKLLRDRADSVLRYESNPNIKNNYVDGSTYGLYYNLQSRHGNSHDEIIYEDFDKYLKDSLLEDFFQKRRPIMHKIE